MTTSQVSENQLPEKSGFFASFKEELVTQRWDDHRYYHQSRINQTLHFISSISFMTAYVMLFINPALAALIGWMVGMVSRQSGHFFFEPRDYDKVNKATHEHKEDIKVGYNLSRKRVLHAIWAAVPVALYIDPTFFGQMQAYEGFVGYIMSVSLVWLYLGAAALLFRTLQLFFIRDIKTGIVWFTKILTDPFHDFKIYRKAPGYLLRGQLMDPMTHTFEEKAS